MNKILENNKVTISGEIVSEFKFNHEIYGERFYLVEVDVPRTSGYVDRLPVMVSEYLMDAYKDLRGYKVIVKGQYRSYNKHGNNRNCLILSIFALEVEFVDEPLTGWEGNSICLEGTICKEPVYRVTPLGREITDLLIAVNRPYGKSDYIPCICWGRTAKFASGLEVGDKCSVKGRVQSRNYTKNYSDGGTEERIAYEVSLRVVERKKLDETDLQ